MKTIRKKLLILFFISGALGLIYQILCVRILGNIFGNATYAVSTVLAGFMAGMALGAWYFGKLVDRNDVSPLGLYAKIQALAGIYILLSIFIFPLIHHIYSSLGFIEKTPLSVLTIFVMGFFAVLVPTFMLGGMLPVVSSVFKDEHSSEGFDYNLGLLYSVNTWGAAFGAFAAGYFLIMAVGVRGSLIITGLISILVSGAAFYIEKRISYQRERKTDLQTEKIVMTKKIKIITAAAALSGLTALSYEVAWTRILSMVLGSTVYAFAVMLCAFLAGIALGGGIYAFYAKKRNTNDIPGQLGLYGVIQGGIGISVLLIIPAFGLLPALFLNLFMIAGERFIFFQALQFIMALGIMIIPTALFGLTLPLACSIYRAESRGVKDNKTPENSFDGRSVGRVYAADTAGALAGTLAAGFALIPLVGIQKAVISIAMVNILLAVIMINIGYAEKRARRGILTAALLFFSIPYAIAMPEWDKKIISSGIYQYAPEYREDIDERNVSLSEIWRSRKEDSQLLFYREGTHFTVSVEKMLHSGVTALRIDGKVDASSSFADDMETHKLLAHLPVIIHGSPSSSLVIGLGSGITLGSVTHWETLDRIDCVEIEPAMKKASSYFNRYSGDPLSDKRVSLIINDARSYLNATELRYDVIASVPSNPWMSGSASLFTYEFFNTVKEKLNPGGVFGAWIQRYKINPKEYASVIKSMEAAFDNLLIFNVSHSDSLIIATDSERKISFNDISRGFSAIESDMHSIGIFSIYDLLARFLAGRESVSKIASSTDRMNTDDRPVMEFAAARNTLGFSGLNTHSFLENFRESPTLYINDFTGHLSLAQSFMQRNYYNAALVELRGALNTDESALEVHSLKGYIHLIHEQVEDALESFNKALTLDPGYKPARLNLGQAYMKLNEINRAEKILKEIINDDPSYIYAYNNLGDLLVRDGRLDEAREVFEDAIEADSSFIPAYLHMAKILLGNYGDARRAEEYLKEALNINPNSADAYYLLGNVYLHLEEPSMAEEAFNRAMQLDPGYISLLLPESGGRVSR